MEKTQTATEPASGGTANAVSQDSGIDSQGSDQSQQTGQSQVERTESQKSSQDEGGGQKASKFYQQRQSDRQTIRNLQDKISELESIVKKPASSVSQVQSVQDKSKQWWDNFLVDPTGSIQGLIEEAIRKEVPGVVRQEGLEKGRQEAEKKIVSNEAYKRDPEGFIDTIKAIKDEFRMEYWIDADPVGAAEKMLQIYQERYGKSRPSGAPAKGQMVSTATGSPLMTGAPDKNVFISELRKMQEQLMQNVELRNDSKFQERFTTIKNQLMSSNK